MMTDSSQGEREDDSRAASACSRGEADCRRQDQRGGGTSASDRRRSGANYRGQGQREAAQERATVIIEAEQQTTYSAKTDEVAAREQAPTVEAEQTAKAKTEMRRHKSKNPSSRWSSRSPTESRPTSRRHKNECWQSRRSKPPKSRQTRRRQERAPAVEAKLTAEVKTDEEAAQQECLPSRRSRLPRSRPTGGSTRASDRHRGGAADHLQCQDRGRAGGTSASACSRGGADRQHWNFAPTLFGG